MPYIKIYPIIIFYNRSKMPQLEPTAPAKSLLKHHSWLSSCQIRLPCCRTDTRGQCWWGQWLRDHPHSQEEWTGDHPRSKKLFHFSDKPSRYCLLWQNIREGLRHLHVTIERVYEVFLQARNLAQHSHGLIMSRPAWTEKCSQPRQY